MTQGIKILLFFYCSLNISFGQSQNIQFDYLTTEDGLSNNIINCIVQDPQGFMWFGTEYGLNRWDGNEFRIFNHIF